MAKYVLIPLLLLIGTTVFSQENGDSGVIILNSKSQDKNFQKILSVINECGLTASKIVADIGYVRTKPITYSFTQVDKLKHNKLVVEVYCEDKSITISGYNMRRNPRKYDTVFEKDNPSSIAAFELLTNIANNLTSDFSYQ